MDWKKTRSMTMLAALALAARAEDGATRVERWTADLGASSFEEREKAQRELEEYCDRQQREPDREDLANLLEKLGDRRKDPEIRARIEPIIARLRKAWLAEKGLRWIWTSEKPQPMNSTSFFRRTFQVADPEEIRRALFVGTADDHFVLYVNEVEVGRGDDWQRLETFDLKKHLVKGDNIITISAKNDSGPAGLLAQIQILSKKGEWMLVSTDKTWKAKPEAQAGGTGKGVKESDWNDANEVASPREGSWREVATRWLAGEKPSGK